MPTARHTQYFRPTGQLITSDAPAVAAVVEFGKSSPHDSTIKRQGDRLRIYQGGSGALTAPTVSDGGAAEFDVAISGSGPWDIQLTWSGAALAALGRGTVTRTITVTSTGASNSPLSIPVKITVL
jgi:hypothetical protein